MAYVSSDKVSKIDQKLAREHEVITTCYHEAGHVLVGLFNYIQVSEVFIYSKPRINGEAVFEIMDKDDALAEDPETFDFLVKNEIQMSYGGLAAETIHYRNTCGMEKLPSHLKMGSQNDVAYISEIVRRYDLAPAGSSRRAYKEKLFLETCDILEQNWEVLRALSHALYKRNYLDFSSIKKIVMSTTKNPVLWFKRFESISEYYETFKVA
jgi:hypothetical protein